MTYPSDSIYVTQPVGDTGQGASAAFHDQVYPQPPTSGAGGDNYIFRGSALTPGAPNSLPDVTVGEPLPAADPNQGQQVYPVADAGSGQQGGQPADAALGRQGGLPADAPGAQTGANPWDTYVMNPVAESRDASAVPPEAGGRTQAVSQLEQQLQATFDEVVKLGTASDLTQPENQGKFKQALTSLVQIAERLGGFDSMQAAAATPKPEVKPPASDGTPQPGMQPVAADRTQPAAAQETPPPAAADGTQPPESAAVQPGAAQPEVNPYEPQVSPNPQPGNQGSLPEVPAEPRTNAPEPAAMQNQLNSQLVQLMSIAKQAQPTAGAPAGQSNSGTVDNFKTALLNVVRTARQLGAQEQGQEAQPA